MAYIVSSGITSTGISLTRNSMTVLDGGTATNTKVNSSGFLYASSGGSANSNTVNPYGSFFIFNGGHADSSYVSGYAAFIYVSSGGIADNTITDTDGCLYVYMGGVANNTTAKSWFYIFDGGVANNTIVQNGINGRYGMYVTAGGTANSTTVNANGRLDVSSGGRTNSTTVNSGGYLYVLNGGVANSITVNSGGSLYVSSGGTALNIVGKPFEASVVVANGAYVTYDTSPLNLTGVYYGSGNKLISSGLALESIDIDSGTSMLVFSNGTATEIVVNSGALLQIASNGIANKPTVDPCGKLFVSSGGTATSILENGGYVEIADDTGVTFTANLFSDLNLSNASATVHSGTTANSATVNSNGNFLVSAGGSANNTRVNSGGRFHVSSGGSVDNTLVNSGGYLYVSTGGLANNATVNNGGNAHISGGTATDITLNNGGFAYVVSGGSAVGVTINSGGGLSVSSGGTAINVDWTPCFGDVSIADGAYVTFTSEYSGVYYGSNNVFLSHAQIIEATAISGSMCVMSDGAVNRITVNNGAILTVSGGSANGTTVKGSLNISSGGTANSTTVNSSGYLHVSSGGTANSNTINYGGRMYVSNGAKANETDVMSGGTLFVSSGGTANNVRTKSSGFVVVSSGGLLISAYFSRGIGGRLITVEKGGIISSAQVQSGTDLYVSGYAYDIVLRGWQGSDQYSDLFLVDGGYAETVSLYSYTDLQISSGGTANDIQVYSSGGAFVHSGGQANSITIHSGGVFHVSAGGTATEILENGGYVNVADGAEATFLSNSFSGLGLQNASATVHSGTTANSVTVSSGGQIRVFDQGIVNSAAIYSNGIIYLSSGGILTGRTYCLGGIIYAYDGAIVNYDLTRTNPGAYALISDLSCIQGTAKYIITVKSNQAEGTYILADVASAFDQTISVESVSGDELGVLTVGDTVSIAGANYTLNLTDNTLSLTIGEKETPSPYTSDGLFFRNETGTVESGELYHDTLILSGGSLIISGKGSANSATVNAGGYLHVSSAAAAHAIVENGGYVTVENGADATFAENTISGLTLTRASATLHSNTTANNAILNSSGCLYVSSGGTANSTIVSSGGYLRVYSGGMANNAIVYYSGFLHVSGGTANDANIDGIVRALNGGTVNRTTLTGSALIFSGGIANDITVNPYGGIVHVSNGGIVNSITVNYSATAHVSNGGTANSTTVNVGQFFVSSGGYASNAIIIGNADRQQGDIYIYYRATIEDVTVNEYGDFYVSSGGTANDTTVNAYGGMWIYSGGTATGIKENGGYVWFDNGASVAFASNTFSGAILNSEASATVHSGTTAVSVTLNQSSYLAVYSGGTATDLVWTPCNGTLWIEDGAYVTYVNLPEGVFYGGGGVLSSNAMTMEEITVLPNQTMYVMSNGIANSTTVSSAGSVVVSGGGLANSTTVNFGGRLYVSSGGTAYNATVLSSGSMRVISGGSAAHIEASSGALLDLSIAPDTYIEGTYADSAFEVKDGSATYYSVNSGNILRVSSGGIASRTYVYAGGNLYVSNGGIANRAVLSNGAMTVRSGGVATSTTVNSGNIYISNGGIVNSVTVNGYARMYVSNGGAANSVTLNLGSMFVSSGGTVDSLAITGYDGWLFVSSGGKATNITADNARMFFYVAPETYVAGTSNGLEFEIKDGKVSDFTVQNGGGLYIMSGGTADNINISGTYYDYAFMEVFFGGVANHTAVSYRGWFTVFSGGVANETTVNASMWVSSGGIANSTTINNGGSMWVSSGAKANDLLINNGGRVRLYSATASDTTINQGGSMWVSSGGTVTDLRVNSGGYLYFEHAKLTGKITIADGGTIQAGQGAVIDFDISRLAPNMGALLNNLSRIQNDAPAFTLTVSDLQWNGTYKLAQGVTEFDNLISVKSTASQTIHMVAVDETANVDGIEYTLKLTGNTLSVTVTGGVDIPVIPVSADVTDPTREPVTVTADFSDAAIMREYSFDNDTWHVYTEPVTFRQNGTVYFLGKDQRGFINEVASYDVTNIDLTPPDKPTVTADITELTNTDVAVTAEFSEDAKLKEYSRDGEKWLVYTGAVVFEQNGTAYFRAIDALGNESEVVSYSVTNIDKTPPAAPTARANITSPTNQTVKVSASFSNDTAKREYSQDGENWSDYTSAIQFTENGTVYFRATDAVGNVSGITTFEVTNIDTERPEAPTLSADVTELTNTDVLVTAEFSEDSTRREYSFDGYNWRTYSGPVRFTSNGTAYFRGIDDAGNESELASYIVDYIDKSAPNKPTVYADVTNITNGNVFVSAVYSEDSVAYEYSYDNRKWEEYTDAVMFTENGTVYFRGIDEAGNYSGVAKYVVSNIDKTAPAKPTAYADVTEITSGDVMVSAVFSNDSAVREYSLDGRTWKPYTEAVQFVKNGNIYFRSFDTAGNVSEVAGFTVNNIIKARPEKPSISVDITEPTNGIVTVSAKFGDEFTINQYSLDGKTWKEYTGPVSFDENGSVSFRSVDVADNISEIATYQVTNIDKTPPEKPIPMANVTAPTNMDVLVTATFSGDSVIKQYSLDRENWGTYPGGVLFGANLPVYFRSIDAAGNISEIASYTVTNVDRSAPVITLTGNNQTPARQATLSAAVDDGSLLYYCRDDSGWTEYKGAITVSTNATYSFRATDVAGNTGITEILFANIQIVDPTNLAEPQTQTWEKVEKATQYVVEYSTDNFEHVIQLTVNTNSLDSFQLPAGNYQMRVKADVGEEWTVAEPVIIEETDNEPKFVMSDSDGNSDVFFANTVGTWKYGYVAQHVSSIDDTWSGTKETIKLSGKNRLADIFEGSSDANILLMTDDANGDALFVDDIFSDSPDKLGLSQSRIARIDEIRAGAGNDIVDMTSRRFKYTGEGLTIRGGDGNDIIWANKGDNKLFGDAGNDRIVGASGNDVIAGGIGSDSMHGGGGDDVFTFCDNWGIDTAEQLATGTVTLWFASGDESKWDAGSLTYTDGKNSVTVSGVTAGKVELKFGSGNTPEDAARFAALSDMGAFDAFTSQKIFEESGKGILA